MSFRLGTLSQAINTRGFYMKQCVICKKWKNESEFYVKKTNKDGTKILRSDCKQCHCDGEKDRYYKKRVFVDSRKTPCLKCGENRIRCISFHHINPNEKEFTIGQFLKSDFDVIENEINKCVCLCLNCHHEFHFLNKKNGTTLDEYLCSNNNSELVQ